MAEIHCHQMHGGCQRSTWSFVVFVNMAQKEACRRGKPIEPWCGVGLGWGYVAGAGGYDAVLAEAGSDRTIHITCSQTSSPNPNAIYCSGRVSTVRTLSTRSVVAVALGDLRGGESLEPSAIAGCLYLGSEESAGNTASRTVKARRGNLPK